MHTTMSVLCPGRSDSWYSPITKTSLCTSSLTHFLTSGTILKETEETGEATRLKHANTNSTRLDRSILMAGRRDKASFTDDVSSQGGLYLEK